MVSVLKIRFIGYKVIFYTELLNYSGDIYTSVPNISREDVL